MRPSSPRPGLFLIPRRLRTPRVQVPGSGSLLSDALFLALIILSSQNPVLRPLGSLVALPAPSARPDAVCHPARGMRHLNACISSSCCLSGRSLLARHSLFNIQLALPSISFSLPIFHILLPPTPEPFPCSGNHASRAARPSPLATRFAAFEFIVAEADAQCQSPKPPSQLHPPRNCSKPRRSTECTRTYSP